MQARKGTYGDQRRDKSLSKHPKLTPEAVQAAQVLKNGQAKKQFPLAKEISKPASYPMHYDRLVEGLHKTPMLEPARLHEHPGLVPH
ncbi:hypothetical protein LENED_003218 [Lentinula edodes]|uniref:Uncharacterized protein n=1 Tax=Lentinula edodes TaxID=5353 RepID=A0A1Q3E300_LENED|nr:hypothetical protein LENED_003218 [Lentinula edodes]